MQVALQQGAGPADMGTLDQPGGGLDVAALTLPYPEMPDGQAQYRAQLADLQVGFFDGNRPDAYSRWRSPPTAPLYSTHRDAPGLVLLIGGPLSCSAGYAVGGCDGIISFSRGFATRSYQF